MDAEVRRQEGHFPDTTSMDEAGCLLSEGAHRGREVPGRRRPVLPIGRRGRGDPVCRNSAQDGERRPDRGRRSYELATRPRSDCKKGRH